MNRIGRKIDLDTGDLVSSAGRARQSIASITDEMKKAKKEGRFEDFAKLSFEKDRLQSKTSGFENDIKTLANDPRFQTQASTGGVVLKIDSEYVTAVRTQTDAIKKLTDEYQRAIRNGNMEKIHELTPQIEKQQSNLHRTVRDIIDTGGEFSQRPGIDGTADGDRRTPRTPPITENNDWRELKGLSGAISREHAAGDWERVSRLGINKDALRGIMGEYDRDSTMETKIKADPELASQLKEIRDALKGTIAALDEASANGEYEKVDQLTGQAKQLQRVSHKMIEESMPSVEEKGGTTARAIASVLSAQVIVGSVTRGIEKYVSHLDRSGIVSKMGSGDVIGAEIEELRRKGDAQSAMGESVGGVVGGALAALVAALVPGGAAFAEIASGIGATFGSGIGRLLGIDEEAEANIKATSEASSKQWEQRAPGAMELTALFGKYGGTDAENSKTLRRMFEDSANTATRYGFSPEEGMEQVKQAAYQGLNERQALDAARDVFAFERGTGTDRGVLSEFRSLTKRFGVSNGLNTAWQGNQASGMAPAQFNEFLRSMQKTFEDGISKGFVRGVDEIAANLSFLSNLNGGSELWKGEQGANRLSQMNSGLEATTALSSVSDILSFRGAQNVLKQWDNAGMTLDGDGRQVSVADKNWRAIGDLDPKKDGLEIRRGYDYVDSMIMLERGLTPELFHSQMKMIEGVEGVGNRTGAVEQMKNIYGLNYTGAAALYQTYQDKLKTFNGNKEEEEKYFSGDKWKEELEEFKKNPENSNSTELTMLAHVADIKKYTYEIGQWHLDKKMPEIVDALKKAWEEAREKGNTNDPLPGNRRNIPERNDNPFPPAEPPDWKSIDTKDLPPDEAVKVWQQELKDAQASKDPERIRNAVENLDKARIQADVRQDIEDPLDKETRELGERERRRKEIIDKNKGATKYLFAEWTGGERAIMNSINDTVKKAVLSGDISQFNAAEEFADLISIYGASHREGKPYDDNNTFNSLSEFSGDILGMLEALRSLIERIDGVKVNVTTE
jgi:hypothetical protein